MKYKKELKRELEAYYKALERNDNTDFEHIENILYYIEKLVKE